MSPWMPGRGTPSRGMVYLPSMITVLAALLLAAAAADGHIGEEPAPIPAQAEQEATATNPAAAVPAPAAPQPQAQAPAALPEATSPQLPAKQAAPKQQLRILAQDSRMDAYAQFRELYEQSRFDEALPYAKRVVELSEADPERDHELPIAYNNLGATQYQLGDYRRRRGELPEIARAPRVDAGHFLAPPGRADRRARRGLRREGRARRRRRTLRPRTRREPPLGRPLQPAAAAARSSRPRTAATRSATSAAPSASTCTRSRSPSRTSATAMRARSRRCSNSPTFYEGLREFIARAHDVHARP